MSSVYVAEGNKKKMTDNNKKSGNQSWPQDDRPREKLLKKGAER